LLHTEATMNTMNIVVNLIMGSAACFLSFVGLAFLVALVAGVAGSLAGVVGVAGKRRKRRGREQGQNNTDDDRNKRWEKYLEGPFGAYIEF